MSDVFKLTTKNARVVLDQIINKNRSFFQIIKSSWGRDAQILLGKLIRKQYSGRPGVKKITGNLARLFLSNTQIVGNNVVQKIFIDKNNPAKVYMAIHDISREGGGIIRAKRSTYLTFQNADGNWVKVQSVFIPARTDVLGFINKELPKLRIRSLNDAVKVFA